MIELIQFPWSPYCLVQKHILDFSSVRYKVVNVPPSDRSLIWRLSKKRYYQVPIVKDGRNVLFETDENSQVIAKYLDAKLQLGLFPPQWDGLQRILWRYIDNDVEGATFRLNDAHYREFVPDQEQLNYLRFKERRFGRGCLDQWFVDNKKLQAQLAERLSRPQSFVSKFERGERRLDVIEFRRITNALGVDAPRLLRKIYGTLDTKK